MSDPESEKSDVWKAVTEFLGADFVRYLVFAPLDVPITPSHTALAIFPPITGDSHYLIRVTRRVNPVLQLGAVSHASDRDAIYRLPPEDDFVIEDPGPDADLRARYEDICRTNGWPVAVLTISTPEVDSPDAVAVYHIPGMGTRDTINLFRGHIDSQFPAGRG